MLGDGGLGNFLYTLWHGEEREGSLFVSQCLLLWFRDNGDTRATDVWAVDVLILLSPLHPGAGIMVALRWWTALSCCVNAGPWRPLTWTLSAGE